ncbi:bacteriocin fulvocin C-related protein [Flavobacterium sp.]|jgi:hypothetical protein|uniref:bacteriocin fulvocin C-related protein n=1 Tax=Flavobacterium sp. TaxID=239 RepID=UPI0037BEFA77
MKKLILTLGIVLSLLSSCTTDDTVTNQENSKITSVLKEKNYDTQKLMYRMLSKEEKQEIWVDKIDVLISDSSLSGQQVSLLKDLKNHLNVTLFDTKSNNDEREVFKTIYVKDFLNKAKSLFSEDYVYNNFFTISGNNSSSKLYDSKPICSCNQGSMWSCGMATSTCRETDKCRKDSDGCGFATMFECNGNCFNN